MANYIGEKIKKYRKEKNLLQEDLAKMTGISRVSLGNYERGTRTPSAEILDKIALALKVSINEFVPESPIRKLRNQIRSKKEMLFDLNIKSDEIERLSNSLLEEMRHNLNDAELIHRYNKSETEFQAIQNQITYIKHEYDELIRKLNILLSKAATYTEFGDFYLDEDDRIEGKKLIEEMDDMKNETLVDNLLNKFDKLNINGKKEAVKRVDELTQIPTYTRDETFIVNHDEADKEK